MKKNNKKAFTLVELLVVIAIIAILAVVSVVGYTVFTKKARDSVAQQELSQAVNLLIAEDATNEDLTISDEGMVYKVYNNTDSSAASSYAVKDEDFRKLFADLETDLNALEGEFTVTCTATAGAAGADGSEEEKYTFTVTVTEITYTTKDGGTATYTFKTTE